MSEKKQLLVIDDDADVARFFTFALKSVCSDAEILHASNFLEAVDILSNPENTIIGAVCDNRFPLAVNTASVGMGHIGDGAVKEAQLCEQGGAGVMLMRMIRTGTTGVCEPECMRLLAGVDDIAPEISKRYADIPILWNTGKADEKKIGVLLKAINSSLREEEITGLAMSDPDVKFVLAEDQKTIVARKPLPVTALQALAGLINRKHPQQPAADMTVNPDTPPVKGGKMELE